MQADSLKALEGAIGVIEDAVQVGSAVAILYPKCAMDTLPKFHTRVRRAVCSLLGQKLIALATVHNSGKG